MHKITMDWRTIDEGLDETEAFALVRRFCEQAVDVEWSVAYVEYEDCGDYPCNNDDIYKAEMSAEKQSVEAFGPSVSSAILRATRDLLREIEEAPIKKQAMDNAVQSIPEDELREIVREAVNDRYSSKATLRRSLAKYAGIDET